MLSSGTGRATGASGLTTGAKVSVSTPHGALLGSDFGSPPMLPKHPHAQQHVSPEGIFSGTGGATGGGGPTAVGGVGVAVGTVGSVGAGVVFSSKAGPSQPVSVICRVLCADCVGDLTLGSLLLGTNSAVLTACTGKGHKLVIVSGGRVFGWG